MQGAAEVFLSYFLGNSEEVTYVLVCHTSVSLDAATTQIIGAVHNGKTQEAGAKRGVLGLKNILIFRYMRKSVYKLLNHKN